MKRRSFPVEVLWCANARGSQSNGWSFPRAVDRRLQLDCAGKRVLQLFGGRATFGTRMDVDSIVTPDVIADAWLPPFAKDSFDVVIIDPPYERMNAQMKCALFRGAAWIARERVIWFSTIWMASAAGMKPERSYLVRVGDNCYVRALQYFRVPASHDKYATPHYFGRGPAMKYNRWLAQPGYLPHSGAGLDTPVISGSQPSLIEVSAK